MSLKTVRWGLAEYRSPVRRHEALFGILFTAPWIIGFLAFVAVPFLASLVLSFTSYKVGVDSEWIGLANYREMFTGDDLFWKSLYNTGYYVFFAVPLGIVGSLLLALLMNQKVWGIPVFRTMVYVPSIVSGVAVAYLWMWLLDPNIGLINYMLRLWHLPVSPVGPKRDLGQTGVDPRQPLQYWWRHDGHLLGGLAKYSRVPL
ncbi:MAG: sugar ABC transporter permease [Caldilineaceae bacterium]